jgi:hypothetical protein
MLDAKRVIGGGLIAGALLVGGPAGLALADSHGGGEPGKPGGSTTTVTNTVTNTTNSGQSGNSGGSGNNTSTVNVWKSWTETSTTINARIRDSFNTDNSRNVLSRNVFANGNLSGNNVAIFSNNKVTIVAFSFNGNSHN